MNASLPPHIAARISALLEGVSRKDLARIQDKLSAAYRAGGTSAGVTGAQDVLAYLVARAPATYAAVRAVLARLAEVMPDFAPVSLLDVGAGPGTAGWAALDAWPGVKVTMLEHNPAFRAMAARLMPDASIIAGDLGSAKPKADLVVAAYVLAELPERLAANAAADLWNAASGALVLVEPGTPQGFARIRLARAALIESGAHVAAPCTHDGACPMSGSDWCHFSQRVQRSRDHMRLKDASVPFEDERYSYVVVTRAKVAAGARIIKPVAETRIGVTLPLCDASGLHDALIPKRDKDAFKRARKQEWGDLFLPW